jgi:hypothetical protein
MLHLLVPFSGLFVFPEPARLPPDADVGAAFLAVISPDGTKQVLVRTDPYVAYAATFAPDGTIWTAGEELANGEELRDYSIIRRFDKDGNLLGKALPRTRFPEHPQPLARSRLVAARDRVGWFAPRGAQYIEFSLDGKELAAYPLASLDANNIAGVALCDDDTLWVSIQSKGADGKARSTVDSQAQRPAAGPHRSAHRGARGAVQGIAGQGRWLEFGGNARAGRSCRRRQ